MRKIELGMILAIAERRNWSADNTDVKVFPNFALVQLHGNNIASFNYVTNTLEFNEATLAEWPTRTTKSRCRALSIKLGDLS